MQSILITDYVHLDLITGLRSAGVRVLYAPGIPPAQAETWLPHFEGVVVNTKMPVGRDLMKANPQLKFIGRLGVGLEIIDMEAAAEYGIQVVNTPGANANAVAEHCVGMLLALIRKIPKANAEVKIGGWIREQNRGVEIRELTIGIIGYGNTGRAFASKFAGWQTRVIAYDKYKTHYTGEERFVREASLEEVQLESDVVSLHIPLTDETRQLVNADFLARCRKGVILINSARGKVVDLEALLLALQSGHVAGACLDVLGTEDPAKRSADERNLYGQLFAMDNVICTPHIAGWTWTSRRDIARQMLEKIQVSSLLKKT